MMNTECEFNLNSKGKYECAYCAIEVPVAGVHSNCKEKLRQREHGMESNAQPYQRPPAPEPPPLLTRLAHFAVAAAAHAVKGNPTVTEEVMQERLAICRACPLFKVLDPEKNTGVCTHQSCGCTIQD